MRTAIAKFDRDKCIEIDEKLSEVYGEPNYDIVYSKDIFNMKKTNNNIFEDI